MLEPAGVRGTNIPCYAISRSVIFRRDSMEYANINMEKVAYEIIDDLDED